MADLLDFPPLYPNEDEATIRARWEAWANEGVTPDQSDEWTDTRPGTFFWISTTPGIREFARFYDLIGSEVPASAFPQWSWSEYLDDLAEARGLSRLAATPASGVVTFTGPEGTPIPAGAGVSPVPPDEDTDVPEFETTQGGVIPAAGELDLPLRATEAGVAGNVPAGALTRLLAEIDGVGVANAAPVLGGTDPETDEALSTRLVGVYEDPPAGGNQAFYRKTALDHEGVGGVTVIPHADGPGTVTVIVSAAGGDPVAPEVVDSLQALLDPLGAQGQGAGLAPYGVVVTVVTAASLAVTVAATVELEQGYALDGTAALIGVRAEIEAAVRAYVESIPSGAEVVRQKVVGAIISVQGVHDVANVTINGVAANLAVPAAPPAAPSLAAVNLVTGNV